LSSFLLLLPGVLEGFEIEVLRGVDILTLDDLVGFFFSFGSTLGFRRRWCDSGF